MPNSSKFDSSGLNRIGSILQERTPISPGAGGFTSPYVRYLKRPLDVCSVLLAAPIVIPVLLVLILMIVAKGDRPFYSQLRVGRSGRSFRLWKLRTMVENADLRLAEYIATNEAARAEWDATQKLKNDPRITPIGRFLRKSSLDELPQLWNVFVGDMSIVGPRPMMLEQAQLYPGADYYHLRPGVTGLWQISDRNDSTFAARATFDAKYASEMSWANDMSIIAKTVTVVFRCTGY
ncbi:sugar transferase [Paracoccus aestuariivivens]|uniref:Sugar transferase n=2 Tax=Paracoccus aestuariivivens TaxID=1820333 RepID=A0A6L6JD18_9RHOB|nr:sugar transferase [Paracoccus aestuariivivens]MTH77821.1 sugar transferase [Paracoccus aestuariivivens]